MADSYEKSGKNRDAVKIWYRIETLNKGNSDNIVEIKKKQAELELSINNIPKAFELFTDLYSQSPEDSWILGNLYVYPIYD